MHILTPQLGAENTNFQQSVIIDWKNAELVGNSAGYAGFRLGAVLAYLITELFEWRTAYFIGGGLGLMLLFMLVKVFKSGIFTKIKEKPVSRGNFFQLFTSSKQFFKYLRCILIGVPV